VKRVQIPATKEPANLIRQKQTNGLGYHCPVDTHAESRVGDTATEAGAAANQAAANEIDRYDELASTHIFYPIAIETGGTWHHQAVELVQELGRRATIITGDSRETTYLFQQLSVALQKGTAVSFQNTFTAG